MRTMLACGSMVMIASAPRPAAAVVPPLPAVAVSLPASSGQVETRHLMAA